MPHIPGHVDFVQEYGQPGAPPGGPAGIRGFSYENVDAAIADFNDPDSSLYRDILGLHAELNNILLETAQPGELGPETSMRAQRIMQEKGILQGGQSLEGAAAVYDLPSGDGGGFWERVNLYFGGLPFGQAFQTLEHQEKARRLEGGAVQDIDHSLSLEARRAMESQQQADQARWTALGSAEGPIQQDDPRAYTEGWKAPKGDIFPPVTQTPPGTSGSIDPMYNYGYSASGDLSNLGQVTRTGNIGDFDTRGGWGGSDFDPLTNLGVSDIFTAGTGTGTGEITGTGTGTGGSGMPDEERKALFDADVDAGVSPMAAAAKYNVSPSEYLNWMSERQAGRRQLFQGAMSFLPAGLTDISRNILSQRFDPMDVAYSLRGILPTALGGRWPGEGMAQTQSFTDYMASPAAQTVGAPGNIMGMLKNAMGMGPESPSYGAWEDTARQPTDAFNIALQAVLPSIPLSAKNAFINAATRKFQQETSEGASGLDWLRGFAERGYQF